MLWFFFFMFFVFLCFYKIIKVLHKSGTTHLDDPPPIQNTTMPSSSSRSYSHDVFLSFRGEDVRKKFVDHLYKALKDRLIRTYKDDITLPRGESVGPALLEAIEESKFAVMVFSKNYADSSWCLDELVHIMKCRAERGLIVIPIFYDVEPTEVRKQKGEFGKAFAKLTKASVWRKLFAKQETLKVDIWRKALVAASTISGWDPKNVANGHEAAVIQIIVDAISDKLFSPNSDIDKDEELVGMRARVQDLIKSLEIGTGGVRMVGIWGVGGGGKTTLATSVYNEISQHFGGHCTVQDIREKSSRDGLTTLQEKLLSAFFPDKVVQNEKEGKRIIKNGLGRSKVLILLDDVDDCEQLKALAGSKEWFGDGSRIIITTRNEQLLKAQRVDYISQVRLLSHDEANQLFKRHAYNEEDPVKEYETLSSCVVSYCAGLPLALKVLGTFLYDKDEKEWRSTLERLKNIPEDKIMEKLKISYDGLKEVEQELFLDIACFFRHERKDDAMEIFEACDFHPVIGIKVLIQKALITIDSEDGCFDMHDLIQEMGHYIVRGKHPNNPEKHSRVWKHEDISNMCIEDATTENDKIESLGDYEIRDLVPSQFFKFVSNLKKLRWIHVKMSNDDNLEGPNFLSNELRYINWANYPASPFPDNFHPMNLVVLKMIYSSQKELWRSQKRLPKLKVLQLCALRNLASTPNFDDLPCLQNLELRGCENLEEIHPSIGNHRSLKSVKVIACPNLIMFPTIFKMEKLELLEICYCHKSLEFPNIQANMESLVKLHLNGIGIEGLLSSIGECCTSLISLELYNCFIIKSIEIDFDGLKHLKDFRFDGNTQPGKVLLTHCLQRLDLVNCCLVEDGEIPFGEIPFAIGEMSNLQELNLTSQNFSKLDFSISQLTRLKLLKLSYCERLLELPRLPSSISILLVRCCDSLTDVGDFYVDCKMLRYASLISSNLVIDGNRLLQFMLQGENAENQCVTLQLQGLEIPKGFTPRLREGGNVHCNFQRTGAVTFVGS